MHESWLYCSKNTNNRTPRVGHDQVRAMKKFVRIYERSSFTLAAEDLRQPGIFTQVRRTPKPHRPESKQVPGTLLLFGIIVMQVVASHPRAGQYMILAAINDVQADPQGLNHGSRPYGAGHAVSSRRFGRRRHQRIVVTGLCGAGSGGRCRPVPSGHPRPIRPAKVGAFWSN